MHRFISLFLLFICLSVGFVAGVLQSSNSGYVLLSAVAVLGVSIFGIMRIASAGNKKLAMHEEFYSSMLHSTDVGLYRANLDGECLFANDVCMSMAESLLVNSHVNDGVVRIPFCEDSEMRKLFMGRLFSEGEIFDFGSMVESSNGKYIHIIETAKLVFNDHGQPLAIVGSVKNLSSTNVEEELVPTFGNSPKKVTPTSCPPFSLSNLCHELRTPFVGIIGSFKALTDEELPERAKGYADKGLKSAERFKDALNELLHDFSDEDEALAGKELFSPTSIFLKKLDIFIPAADLEGRTIEFLPDSDVPIALLGCGRSVSQAVFGLLSNGLSQLKGTKLTAGVSARNMRIGEGDFLFWISDCSDKSDNFSESLISDFFRDAVRKINGNIYVERDNGVTFGLEVTFEFSADVASPQLNNDNKSKKILLAEDDLRSQFMLRKKLEQWGYTVRTVANGLEVLKSLKKEYYDLVLMDIQMPEMDGYQAITSIRENESSLGHIPIIVMSAYGKESDFGKLLSLGIGEYISKPIRMDTLKEMISKYLS